MASLFWRREIQASHWKTSRELSLLDLSGRPSCCCRLTVRSGRRYPPFFLRLKKREVDSRFLTHHPFLLFFFCPWPQLNHYNETKEHYSGIIRVVLPYSLVIYHMDQI